MRWFSRKMVLCALLIGLAGLVTAAYAGPGSLTLSASGFAFATSDSHSGESADSGPSPASDGYVGTFSWNYSISTGTGSISYYVVYQVDYWDDSTGTWQFCNNGTVTVTDAAGSSGSHGIDFYTDPLTPAGYYQLSAWVFLKDSSGDVGSAKGGNTGNYALANSADDPLPDPQPDPGTYPGTPPPPTSGPIGPGTHPISF
jgi:hypothetical protein